MTRSTFVTDFARQAVVVGVANLCTDIVIASFANSTGYRIGAWYLAQVTDAHVAVRAAACRHTGGRNPNAALIGRWISIETGWTFTFGHVLIDLTNSIRSADILVTWILAVIVVARQITGTIRIAAATNVAGALFARLVVRTLCMAGAFDRTLVVHAVLTFSTIILIATGGCTLASATNTVGTVIVRIASERITNTSVFSETGHKLEFAGARTHGFTAFNCAQHVRAAHVMAFVNATATNTFCAIRAIGIAVRTLTNREASGRLRKSGISVGAFAHVTVCGKFTN